MEPHEHNGETPHTHGDVQVGSEELKEYIQHNIRHLEDHINSFNKLQSKIEDKHALKSLKHAVSHLENGIKELKHLLHHL
jgi:predicted  nucleic acid-binding Zn-ribbon protein